MEVNRPNCFEAETPRLYRPPPIEEINLESRHRRRVGLGRGEDRCDPAWLAWQAFLARDRFLSAAGTADVITLLPVPT